MLYWADRARELHWDKPFTEVLEALLSRLRQCGARNDAIALGCGTASALLDLTLLEL